MAWPIVTVASGGLPVTEAGALGVPVEEAANGYGTAVTFVASGGLPVGKLGGVFPASLFGAGDKGAFHEVDLSYLYQDTTGTSRATAVGQTVKRINDKSGNGVHLTNSTGWVLGQDSLGCYYLQADGVSVFVANIAWAGTALTLVSAFNTLTTPAANEQLIGLGNSGNATDFGGIRLLVGTGKPDFYAAGGLGTMTVQPSATHIQGDPHVCMGRTVGPAMYRDRTINVGTGSIVDLSTLNRYTVGGLTRSIVGSQASGRYYGDLAICRSSTDIEMFQINDYFRSRFGANGFFSAVGDSQTFNIDYGVLEEQFYPRRIAAALGDRKIALNFGISGNTTANMLARLSDLIETGKPDEVTIYGSSNDTSGSTTVQAAPAPTTTAFSVASGFGPRFGQGGIITVNGVQAEVLSVATDRITLTAPLGFTPTAGQPIEIDTTANLIKLGQAFQAMGCNRILIPGLHFYNFSSGGDTTSVQSVAGALLRSKQLAAATALGAVYVDLYGFMRALIIAGTYTQGDDLAWHVAVGNPHLNATGEQILADAQFAAMQAQGWA